MRIKCAVITVRNPHSIYNFTVTMSSLPTQQEPDKKPDVVHPEEIKAADILREIKEEIKNKKPPGWNRKTHLAWQWVPPNFLIRV